MVSRKHTYRNITYLQNFINVVSMSPPNGMLVTLVKTGLEVWTGILTHPAFAVEFDPKDLVLRMFDDLIALFHDYLYFVPFYAGTEAVFQNWQKMLVWIFSVTAQCSVFLDCSNKKQDKIRTPYSMVSHVMRADILRVAGKGIVISLLRLLRRCFCFCLRQ